MRRLYTLFALLLAFALFAPSIAAQDASPGASPASGECVAPEIPPGTPTPMEEMGMEEPAASPEGDVAATPEEAFGPPPAPELPPGEPAPDDVVAEVEAAVMNFVYCFDEGNYVAAAALYTPEGLLWDCGTTNVHDGPMCFGGPPVTDVVVSDVQVHEDGKVSADVTYVTGNFPGHERFYFVVDDDGMYWLDITPELPLEIPDGATVIEGEMVDFEFVLDATGAPAGDVAITVTNTGEYPHEIVMFSFPEGLTPEALLEDESLWENVEFHSFAFAEPGQEATLVAVNMEPGTYTLVCFVDVPDGVPHVMRGMVLDFEVTAP